MQLDIFQIPQEKPRRHNACAPVSSFNKTYAGASAVQLDLFTSFKEKDADEILAERAIALLEVLNDGRKKKQRYEPYAYRQISDLILLVAVNQKDYIFNMVDIDGNIPKNFSVNWRNSEHVKQELYQYLKEKGLLIE